MASIGDLLPPSRILLGPGPSMADPRVLRAMAAPLLGQFDPEFTAIMGEDWLTYVRDAFDVLYAEGAEHPKMMSVGLHMRLMGRPGRAAALARFLDHVERHDRVWICRRVDIARHWRAQHPHAQETMP